MTLLLSPIWWLLGGVALVIGVATTSWIPEVPSNDTAKAPQIAAAQSTAEGAVTLGSRVAAAKALLTQPPLVIGPTARVVEAKSGLPLLARVDTGAAVTSLHCKSEDFEIEEASDNPLENLGKSVRLRVENLAGDFSWITTKVLDYVEVRSANGAEHRYRVRLPLQCGPVQKDAIVNLNDRSSMSFRLLLGRDFLAGDFLVDVSQPGTPAL